MPVGWRPSAGYPKGGTVAVVSCGPTAARYQADPRLPRYDAVIGCRSVPARVRCDFWCVADWQPLGTVRPIGSPVVCVRRSVLEKAHGHGRADVAENMVGRPIEWICEPPAPAMPEGVAPWWTWSGTAALGMAWRLQPSQVDLYGVDLCGIMDVDGHADEYNRSDDRWDGERKTVEALVRALRDRGAAVWFARSDDGAQQASQG